MTTSFSRKNHLKQIFFFFNYCIFLDGVVVKYDSRHSKLYLKTSIEALNVEK